MNIYEMTETEIEELLSANVREDGLYNTPAIIDWCEQQQPGIRSAAFNSLWTDSEDGPQPETPFQLPPVWQIAIDRNEAAMNAQATAANAIELTVEPEVLTERNVDNIRQMFERMSLSDQIAYVKVLLAYIDAERSRETVHLHNRALQILPALKLANEYGDVADRTYSVETRKARAFVVSVKLPETPDNEVWTEEYIASLRAPKA